MPGQAPPLTEETDLLLAYLVQARDGLRNAAFGLTDDQARVAPLAGDLSVGGLVKHVTQVERSWMAMVAQRPSQDPEAYEQGFALQPGETLAGALAELDAAQAETEALVRSIGDLGTAIPVPKGVPWFPQDVEAWSLRWVLLHLVQEIARHAGHGDLIREAIDGATMYPLMAAVEGWPATEWLQPWSPTADGESVAA